MPAGVSAWTPLANLTLTGNQQIVTFSSISGSYRDLVLVYVQVTTAAGGDFANVRVNGDTGANYAQVGMSGSGSSTVSGANGANTQIGTYNAYATQNVPCVNVVHFLDYAATDKHKTILVRADGSSTGTDAIAGRWINTAAITSIRLTAGTNFNAGSSFALYGVSA